MAAAPPAADPAAASEAPRPSAELFRLALYHHRAGEFENARTAYLALLARNEMDPRVHNNLGLLYREQGLPDLAVREFQRALILNPDYLTARNNLGVALLGQSRLAEAAAEFTRVLAEDPRNVDAVVNLALVEKAGGRPQRAAESLLRALVLDPQNAPAHFNLASLYEQQGEAARAAEPLSGVPGPGGRRARLARCRCPRAAGRPRAPASVAVSQPAFRAAPGALG